MPRVVGFAGYSGSGKTTLLCRLIEHFSARAVALGVVKHTHHPVSGQPRGGTDRFLKAGAVRVILAGGGDAVLFEGDGRSERFRWIQPAELFVRLGTDHVLVEGFKDSGDWPRIVVNREGAEEWNPRDPRIVASVSDRVRRIDLPEFHPDDIGGIAAFVDRIFRS